MPKIIVIPFALTSIFLSSCQSYSEQISKLRDGPSSNKLREKLRVPIIDSYMVKTDDHSFGSDRWELKEPTPIKGVALHIFKNILPYDKDSSSLEEWDGILMKINDSVVYQINIISTIKDRLLVFRSGELYVYPLNLPDPVRSRLNPVRQLKEKEVDSIFMVWKLSHLVLNH